MLSKRKKWIVRIVFLIGFCLSIFPLVSSFIEGNNQNNAIQTYETATSSSSKEELEEALSQAREYNDMLYQTQGAIVGDSSDLLSRYDEMLNMTETGVMASLEIPKINVNLPIYHGTEDDVLSIGVGHVEGSSLPVGGKNTRALLTGHRGLPTSKLFTRLDELEKGDLFYIDVCNETQAYQVRDIQTIEPDEVDKLETEPDEDLVSLITCTPYGINTHRLIVTGERVPYEKGEENKIDEGMMSIRELLFMILPFIFLALMIYLILKDRKERKAS